MKVITFNTRSKCKKCGAKLPARAEHGICRKCSCPVNEAASQPKSPYGDKQCKSCGALLSKTNKTGYCNLCIGKAKDAHSKGRKCQMCGGPLSNNSITGLCHKCFYKSARWEDIKKETQVERDVLFAKDPNIFYGEDK